MSAMTGPIAMRSARKSCRSAPSGIDSRTWRRHLRAMTQPFDPAAHDRYPDALIRDILRRVKRIALVGASNNPARPSWIVTKYLIERGYDVIPVNPGLDGQELLGRRVYGTLQHVPNTPDAPIDMVEIFRNSEAAGPITDEALALTPLPQVIWMQLSVRNDAAAARAEAAGVTVIMNRCPKIEYGRLSGEIGWQGINSRILSSKKPALAGKGVQKLTINRPGT
jgi:predicted CoA-binding protein